MCCGMTLDVIKCIFSKCFAKNSVFCLKFLRSNLFFSVLAVKFKCLHKLKFFSVKGRLLYYFSHEENLDLSLKILNKNVGQGIEQLINGCL